MGHFLFPYCSFNRLTTTHSRAVKIYGKLKDIWQNDTQKKDIYMIGLHLK
jgi:hypothetical protein